jgi:hypothetical protein
MRRAALVFLLLLCSVFQSSCSVRVLLAPLYPVYEIPMNGKAMIGCDTLNGVLLGSYNIDQNKNIVEKDIDIFKYDFMNHTRKLDYQIKNTRINFTEFVDYKIPYIYEEYQNQTFFRHHWNGKTYIITKTIDNKEETIFKRINIASDHSIIFVIIDTYRNNKILYYFSSFSEFDCKDFEIIQYDIHTGSIQKVVEGNGKLYSTPYYETKSYIYLEVRDIGQPRKIFCIRKSDFVLEKITPIDRQYLVGSDYNSDLLVAYNHKTFELTLWKGSKIQDIVTCSQFPYPVDSVTIKVYQDKIYLLSILEDSWDSDKRFLRWIQFDPSNKQVVERNWNLDLKYRLERDGYRSNKNDYYILGYERTTRKVVFGIVNLVEGTIHYRETNHKIPKDLEFESSQFIGDQYCMWFEGTSFNDISLTGEKQNFNPTGYYCSLEEPFLQRIKK